MAWDKENADRLADEFQVELRALVQADKEDGRAKDPLYVLRTLQELWKKYYMESGHRRLARVFVRENFE